MRGKQSEVSTKGTDCRAGFLKFAFIISVAALGFSAATGMSFANAATAETISGNLDDGTPYAVHKPAPWNGTIVLDLDGAGITGARLDWMTRHGYAVGGTSRNIVGYNFKKAVENLITVRGIFSEKYGMPKRTLVSGGSRGGFVSRLAMEFSPDIFEGALMTAGGGAGQIATLNMKLDAVWALKQLVNPKTPLKLVNITDQSAEETALKALITEADATPQGRARLTLAAAIEQYPAWADPKSPEPAPDDYDAQYKQILAFFAFSKPVVVRRGVEAVAGGNVSWNNGIDYTVQLNNSGRLEFVKAMYAKAGLSLSDDLQTLAKAPRISADPEALRIAEGLMTYTGKIKGPVMNVDNIGDPVDPTSCEAAYEETITSAGNRNLLRNAYVHAPFHGGSNALELITGFVILISRLDTGEWGSTSPESMNKLAAEIAAESPDLFPGMTARFIEHKPDKPLRTWDAGNYGAYKQ
jgi:hypothetical protein